MKRLGLLSSLALLVPMLLFAAPPINDAFDAPSVLSGFPTTTIGTNIDATLELGERVEEEWDEASVWFRWTSPVTGPVQIDTFGSDFDTTLAIWSGDALSNLTFLVGSDDYEGSQSAVFIPTLSGVTYQISVYGYDDSRGEIKLNITNDVTSHISGRVTGPDGIMPLQEIQASVYLWTDSYWDWVASGITDTNGNYNVGGLSAGTYRVEFNDWENGNYLSKVYDNASDLDSGTDIVVALETTVTDIDASLAIASKISGRVIGPNEITPIQGIQVSAYCKTGPYWDVVRDAETDTNGYYTIGGLPAGTYRVEFNDWQNGNYLSEVYDNAADLDSGTNIVVALETTVTDINASLANASKISGRVTGSDGITPLQDIQATAYLSTDSGWDWVSSGNTDTNGDYVIKRLSAGTYRVQFDDWENGYYISEVYNNSPDLGSGADINVLAASAVTDIDASLAIASQISGTVTDADGITPLRDIQAAAYHWTGSDWESVRSSQTDVNGDYTIGGLPAGTYRIKFYDWHNNFSEVYDNAQDLYSGTDIVVLSETTVTGIDVSWASYSKISGTVTGQDGITPLQGIKVVACRQTGSYWDWVQLDYTDANGDYTIGGLSAGTYRVQFLDDNGNYLFEVYDNATDLNSGTNIVVATETTVTGIDASLALASNLSGTVTGPDGTTPLQGIQVTAYHWTGSYGDWGRSVETDVNGNYTIRGLPVGTYRVQFYNLKGDYISEFYDNELDLYSGTDVDVPTATSVTGIDASLALASNLSGTVTGPDGTTPLQGIQVTAYHWTGSYGDWGRSVETDVNGNYTIGGLPAGTYRVQFYDGHGGYFSEVYANATDLDSGTNIDVPAATSVTGIDASLANASKLSGTVTGPNGITPLQGIEVRAYRWTGSDWGWYVGSDYTDANGDYTIGGLSAGTYRVWFDAWQNDDYLSEGYDDAPDFASGLNIDVPAATTVTGIDASLASVVSLEPRFVGLRQAGVKDWELFYVGSVGEEYILQKAASITNTWEDAGMSFLCQPGTNAILRESLSPVLFWRLRTFP